MVREDADIKGPHAVPHHTSTLAFENYVPTSPVLSSREVGWESLMVRAYHEPAEIEEMTFPTGPDIFLVLITSGAVQVDERDVNGPWVTYQIHTGDWFLTPAGGEPYVLRWRSLSADPLKTLHLHLNITLFSRTVEQVVDHDPTRVVVQNRTGFQDPLLTRIGLTLQQELQQPAPGPVGNLYAETVAQMVSVHLLRHYTTAAIPIHEYMHGLSSHQIRRLTEFILAHLDQNLSLDMLARQVGFSAYHFARLFRQTTGESPHQFVLCKRIEVARRLLKETDMPLTQVALEVGFPNQSHFTQAFKHRLGITPLVYRHGRR
jgi:AraC family transcriptional regulator